MKAILLLGSNQSDPLLQLGIATKELQLIGHVLKQSSVYITAAWGKTDQADFYNQAIQIEIQMSPAELMNKIISIEKRMGRERMHKWEPRIIDIDIICIEELIINEDDLKVPHPYMQDRMFVLKPFAEIYSEWVHPVLHKSISELIELTTDKLEVRKLSIE